MLIPNIIIQLQNEKVTLFENKLKLLRFTLNAQTLKGYTFFFKLERGL